MNCTRFAAVAAFLMLAGCTEMRVDGDAKIFQSSAISSIIGTLLGLGLLALGGLSIVASFWPDRKPRNRQEELEGGTTPGQRVGLALFGFGMGFMGFFLTIISLIFPNKLHVTVYPDRVAMASTFNQAGKEVVVPFANLKSVELTEEFNIGRKRKSYLVFTLKNGGTVKQNAGNNELQAFDSIQQAFAEYQKHPPVEKVAVAAPRDAGPGAPRDRTEVGGLEDKPRFGVNTRIEAEVGPTESKNDGESSLVVGTLESGATSPGAPPKKSPLSALPPVAPRPRATPPAGSIPDAATVSPAPPAGSSSQYTLKRYPITIPVLPDYKIVGPETTVEVGIKLKACYAGSWYNVTVVAINDDDTITCNWDDWKSFTYKMMREDLTIPAAGSSVAETSKPSVASTSKYSLKRYVINTSLPPGYKHVRADTEVKIGMKLGACYSRNWEPVTVVAINDDGTISCSWDKWSGVTYKMVREDLIIAK